MCSKPFKDEQQDKSIEDAAQKKDFIAIFDVIDCLGSGEISPALATDICKSLKEIIISFNDRLEKHERMEGIYEELQENYKGAIASRDERIKYLEGLSSRQQDVIDSQDKLIMALEKRDRYITENYNLPDDFDGEPDGDGGEGDEKE